MLSIPPARIISESPARITRSANIIAFKPDPHILLIVNASIEFKQPPFSAACLAGA